MKKTLLLVTILMSFFAQGMKADEYTTVLEEMIRAGVVTGLGSTSQFDQMKTIAPKIAEYLNGQFITDVAEITAPYYRNNCTTDDMKQMKDYMTSPEIQATAKKVVENIQSNEESLQKESQSVIKTIMDGGTPEDIKPLECSKEYSEALEELFDVMSYDKYAKGNAAAMGQTMVKTIKRMMGQFAGKLGELTEAEQAEIDAAMAQFDAPMKAMGEYYDKNMVTILRNTFIKNVPLESLKAQLKVKDQPFYTAMKRTNEALYEDMPNYSDKIMDLLMPKVTEMMDEMMKSADADKE